MAENRRRRVGVGLLGSGVVGEAIQDLLFRDLKGQIGNDIELEIRKIYTRNPKNKKGIRLPDALDFRNSSDRVTS